MNVENIEGIVDKHSKEWGGLISILEEVQNKYGYLPSEALEIISDRMNRPLVDIYAVATFYKSFSLKQRGKHIVSVCLGTACHVRNAPVIVGEFERQLGVNAGETTPDKEFTLETVACLGACALGPIVVADGQYFSKVDTAKVKKIVKRTKSGPDKSEILKDERIFPVEVSCPRCNHTLMDSTFHIDDKPSIRVTISFGDKHGWLRLSSLYGSYNIESEYDIPLETEVHFFCPHCHAELKGAINCPDCGAQMVSMLVRGGGLVQICSRRGCKGHMLDVIHEVI